MADSLLLVENNPQTEATIGAGNAVNSPTTALNVHEMLKVVAEANDLDSSQTRFHNGVYNSTEFRRPFRGTWLKFDEKWGAHLFVTDRYRVVRIKDTDFINQAIRRAFDFEFECYRSGLVKFDEYFPIFTIRYVGPKKSKCGNRVLRHVIRVDVALRCDVTGEVMAHTTFDNLEMTKWQRERREKMRKSPVCRPFYYGGGL